VTRDAGEMTSVVEEFVERGRGLAKSCAVLEGQHVDGHSRQGDDGPRPYGHVEIQDGRVGRRNIAYVSYSLQACRRGRRAIGSQTSEFDRKVGREIVLAVGVLRTLSDVS